MNKVSTCQHASLQILTHCTVSSQGLRALFTLEHNRIADELYDMAPEADDSFLYNEARCVAVTIFA